TRLARRRRAACVLSTVLSTYARKPGSPARFGADTIGRHTDARFIAPSLVWTGTVPSSCKCGDSIMSPGAAGGSQPGSLGHTSRMLVYECSEPQIVVKAGHRPPVARLVHFRLCQSPVGRFGKVGKQLRQEEPARPDLLV